MAILVTGGAGFIGSNYIHQWFQQTDELLINVDKLTYAANLSNLEKFTKNENYLFIKDDINHFEQILSILKQYQIRAIIHFAAESHVDRSIECPNIFINTNVLGTFSLLEAARSYWVNLNNHEKQSFKFIHVSTDEVYGSLEPFEPPFTEQSQYKPNSPYSASKASSDHLVRSYFHTYGLPVITTNCSNNYGPFQFPEKLIPLCIKNCLSKQDLPIYGDGKQIRDWLFVEDHCAAINLVLNIGIVGEVYNIGSNNEKTNLEIVKAICKVFDDENADNLSYYSDLIKFVKDRPGHDRRYAINANKIIKELGWRPKMSFEDGIKKTVTWYRQNQLWIQKNIENKKQHEALV
jgi:dTDP-glucose 4,6-dehydratase